MSNTSNSSNGIGCFSILTLIFITLKLTNHIDWSWFWVLSPVLIPAIIVIIFIIIVALGEKL